MRRSSIEGAVIFRVRIGSGDFVKQRATIYHIPDAASFLFMCNARGIFFT